METRRIVSSSSSYWTKTSSPILGIRLIATGCFRGLLNLSSQNRNSTLYPTRLPLCVLFSPQDVLTPLDNLHGGENHEEQHQPYGGNTGENPTEVNEPHHLSRQ
ncbi:MAG: hypothetical protein IKL29_07135, partial [Bacteroidaceae bacterium]|nr:hypothetical protein [Bacteroidaceae bacterium]